MARIKVYFLYVPSQRSCIGSILKSAMLVMLVKSSLRCSWQQASKQIGDREEEKKVRPFAPASQLRKVKGQQTWSNIVKFTGSRGDVFAVRTSKPLKKCDTFHLLILYTATKRLRARKIGLQYFVLKLRAVLRASVARATCSAPARIWLAVIDFQNGEQQGRFGSDKKRRNRLQ